MNSVDIANTPLIRRLVPLYAASFFGGLVFCYAVFTLFMAEIGFSVTLISVHFIVSNLATLLTEIPFGIMADRISRKAVLILSLVLNAAAIGVWGSSHSVGIFLIGTALFGFGNAAYSGIYDSLVYDTLLEETGERKDYEKYYGRVKAWQSAGWVIGSLAGALIASAYGLRAAFLWSLPTYAFALAAASLIREPKLHKTDAAVKVWLQIRQIARILFVAKLSVVLLTLVASTLMWLFFMNVDQLWPMALDLPLSAYGPLNAALLGAAGIGGLLAARMLKRRALLAAVALCGVVAVLLLLLRNIYAVLAGEVLIILCFTAIQTVGNGKLHDALPSKFRTGGASIVSSFASLLYMPLVFLFGFLADRHTVFGATYMLIPFALIAALGALVIGLRTSRSGHRAARVPEAVV